jgi:hypothetical protein
MTLGAAGGYNYSTVAGALKGRNSIRSLNQTPLSISIQNA